MKQFKSVAPIGKDDPAAIPVKEIGRAAEFYTSVLGFTLIKEDEKTATLKRDDVQVGLVAREDHDPRRADSFYFDVTDLESLRLELQGKGGKPGAIGIQTHAGKRYRLFFLRECDMREIHDGYCFCFGQPA